MIKFLRLRRHLTSSAERSIHLLLLLFFFWSRSATLAGWCRRTLRPSSRSAFAARSGYRRFAFFLLRRDHFRTSRRGRFSLGRNRLFFDHRRHHRKCRQIGLNFCDHTRWKFNVTNEIGRATSELQSLRHLVCRLLLEKKK